MAAIIDFSTLHPTISVTIVILVAYLYYTLLYDSRRRHMPPLVRGIPLINQTFVHQREDFPLRLMAWKAQYGDIYRTRAGATDFIWLSSPQIVKELVDRRSQIYSSRQPQPMALGAASGGRRMTFMPKSKKWRTLRTITHKLLTPQMALKYVPIQTFEAKQLSVDLLDDPDNFYMHNRRYAMSVILQFVYGRRVPVWDCWEVRRIFEVLKRFVSFRRPGSFLVDTFPSLATNPIFNMFSNWKTIGAEIHKADADVFMTFWKQMLKELENGTAHHSFGKDFVQSNYEAQGLDELLAAYTVGGMIEAGSETTSMSLNNILMGILSNPEIVPRAHEELDRVVGSDRPPNFNDEPNLPYVRAIVKEVLRWRPINKFGQNHFATEDDWYGDFFIPKGSVVMINWWAIHYDPVRFPDPHAFRPERFIEFPLSVGQEAAQPDPLKRAHWAFGGGRRICPGMHIAERSLFLNIARTLWGFNVDFKRDANGEKVPVDFSWNGIEPGSNTTPKPFPCDIRPRSEKHAKILREEWAEAQKVGIDFSKIQFDKLVMKDEEYDLQY